MTHPSFLGLVGAMSLLLPWEQATYKTLNITRNISYFDYIKPLNHFCGTIKACYFFVILGIFLMSIT